MRLRGSAIAGLLLMYFVLAAQAVWAACVPPPPGLAAWWRFEDNLIDSAGDSDLTIVPASGAPYAPGKVARGIDFMACPGPCEIDGPAPFDLSTASFSMDAWVKAHPSWPSQGVAWLVDKRDLSTPDEVGLSLTLRPYVPTGNYVQLQLRAVGGALVQWDWYYGPLFDGDWHLLTVTLERGPDQARARLFVDDQEMAYVGGGAAKPFVGDIDTGTPIRIGRRFCSTACGGLIPGAVDEFEMFDRVLAPNEVEGIYLADRDGKCFCGDHMKCYKIRDTRKFIAEVDLESRFGLEAGCRLKAPAVEYCVPVGKKVVMMDPPGGTAVDGTCLTQEQLCYRLRCDPPVPAASSLTDQFGSHDVTPRTAVKLCTPVPRPTMAVPTTTSSSSTSSTSTSSSTQPTCPCPTATSTTTSTTLPPPWPPCSDPSVTSPQCDGACPVGMMCVDLGTGSCSCAPAGGLACGVAQGPPQCWGECPLDPDTGLEQTCKQAFRCSVSLDKCRPPVQPCPLPEDSCDPLCTCFPPEPIDE